MSQGNGQDLAITQKLDLLSAVFRGKSIRRILDAFSDHQLVQAHGFLWDKLVEIHYLIHSDEFKRNTITKNMVSSALYQRRQSCDLRLDYCKGVECIWSHPVCAGNKVKNNMEIMARTIMGYLNSNNHHKSIVEKPSRKREEVKLWV